MHTIFVPRTISRMIDIFSLSVSHFVHPAQQKYMLLKMQLDRSIQVCIDHPVQWKDP